MKYFCVSDVHGYYSQWMEALEKAGFERDNPNHTLVSCGDNFDRGDNPVGVLEYLLSLPRKVLVRGNHEDLLEEYFARCELPIYDPNKTDITIRDLAKEVTEQFISERNRKPGPYIILNAAQKRVEPLLSQMVDYYETENYVFTHAWVPVYKIPGVLASLKHLPPSPREDWRNATESEWADARWSNPFEMADLYLQADKTIVCGHWHTSVGWARLEGRSEFGEDARFDPYHGDGFIAIDGCTAFTGKVNVLVLEDNPLV